MARQPQLEDVTSSRMQSAPINIAYGNQETQRFWRDSYHRWNNHHQFQDDEEVEEQNHHEDQMMMQNGFSAGICEEIQPTTISITNPEEKENQVATAAVATAAVTAAVEQKEQTNGVTTTQQKIDEMTDDLFEQLLAENERKLRQLISYVQRSSCTQMSHLSFF
uniref:Uncharacterized protein n=1 Tax=Caenorhabditis tropicalis TaxID=1561998 RepID=A0A1I7TN51_9PELO